MTLRELILNTPMEEMSQAKDRFFSEFIASSDISMIEDSILDIETLTPQQICITACILEYLCHELNLMKYMPKWIKDPKTVLPEKYSIYGSRGFLKNLHFRYNPDYFAARNLAIHLVDKE